MVTTVNGVKKPKKYRDVNPEELTRVLSEQKKAEERGRPYEIPEEHAAVDPATGKPRICD